MMEDYDKELDSILDRVKDQYLKKDNILAISFGHKTRNNYRTSDSAIVFHVSAKKPVNELELDNIIPKQIEGYPTDVSVHEGDIELHVVCNALYRPLIPGLSIGTFNTTSFGTLGCVVKINTVADNTQILAKQNNLSYQQAFPLVPGLFLITNQHVLSQNNTFNMGVIQPGGETIPNRICAMFNASAKSDSYDIALAKLNNDGYFEKNQNLPIEIIGSRMPQKGMVVCKYGARTGYSEGIITDIKYTDLPNKLDNAVLIEGVSDSGDSGSVWVEKSTGKAVALHFAGRPTANGKNQAISYPINDQLSLFAKDWSFIK